MKNLTAFLMLILFITITDNTRAQQPYLTIYYNYGEKSKDSHSTTENILINGSVISYSVKYSGRKVPGQKDNEKSCTLSNEQLEKINKIINEKQLAVSDSVIMNNNAHNSGYEVSVSVIITLIRSGITTRVKTKGNPSDLADNPLYKKSLSLLNTIKGMLKQCRQE